MASPLIARFTSPQTAVGLVLGRTGVKAVRVVRREGEVWWDGAVSSEFPLDRAPHPTEIAGGVLAALQALAGNKTRVAAGLSSLQAGLYPHELPFDGEDKVRRVIRFEAEPLFLSPIDDLSVDFVRLDPSDESPRPGLIFGALQSDVAGLLETLAPAGLDPHLVLPESLGLVRAGMRLFRDPSGPLYRLLVDMGASQTGLALFDEDRLVAVRSVPYGGADITHRLAMATGQALFEAEDLKKSLVPQPDGDGPGKSLADAWDPILREILATLAGPFLESGGKDVELVLAGGGERTPGLVPFLSRSLGLPVRSVMDLAAGDRTLAGFSADSLTSYGLALQAIRPGRMANLRQGAQAPHGSLTRHRMPLAIMASLAGLTLLFWGADAYYADYLRGRRQNAARVEMERIFRAAAPHATSVIAPLAQMRQELDQLKKISGPLAGPGPGALDFFLDVSRLVGEYPAVRITDLSIGPASLQITGEGGDFETIDRLKSRLAALPKIEEATIGNARMDPNTRVLNFKITLKRSPL